MGKTINVPFWSILSSPNSIKPRNSVEKGISPTFTLMREFTVHDFNYQNFNYWQIVFRSVSNVRAGALGHVHRVSRERPGLPGRRDAPAAGHGENQRDLDAKDAHENRPESGEHH